MTTTTRLYLSARPQALRRVAWISPVPHTGTIAPTDDESSLSEVSSVAQTARVLTGRTFYAALI